MNVCPEVKIGEAIGDAGGRFLCEVCLQIVEQVGQLVCGNDFRKRLAECGRFASL